MLRSCNLIWKLPVFKSSFVRAKNTAAAKKITECEEVKIPVPWGHISGKWWGDRTQAPVIAIHEYRQNAAAFDEVIPKLNLSSVLAIDLPGHGKSSHFHKGRYLTHLEYLVALRYLTRKLPIGLISFLGHGFGSLLAFFYSAAYFKSVDAIMSVECSRHIISDFNVGQPNAIGVFADRYDEIEKLEAPIPYTQHELLALIKSTSIEMSDEAAQKLFTRSVSEENGHLYYNHDLRTEVQPLSFFNDEDMMMLDAHVRMRVAVIRNVMDDQLLPLSEEEAARPGCFDPNTGHLVRRFGPQLMRERYLEGVEKLRSSCRFLVAHEIRAPQHILLDSGDQVATIFNEFLSTNLEKHQYYYSKKR